jgi:DNA-binding transcriptional LysR family regulator
VSLGYFATAGATLVAPALAALRRDRPEVRVDLKLADPEDPLQEVKQGRADLALVVRPPARPSVDGIRFVHLCDDTYRAVLPTGHRLATKRVLDLADLAAEPWVGSEWPGPCLDAILDACGSAGFRPDFVVESEDYATAQGFVAAGLGVSLVPELGWAAGIPPWSSVGSVTRSRSGGSTRRYASRHRPDPRCVASSTRCGPRRPPNARHGWRSDEAPR